MFLWLSQWSWVSQQKEKIILLYEM
jgi:hypothetical protein